MRWAIGMDIGGTKTAVAAVDENGRVGGRVTLPTEAASGFERFLERIGRAIEEVTATADWPWPKVAGIGIGCAGPVNPFQGSIHNPYTLPGWDNCQIVAPLAARFNVPVRLENDADAAALGECFAGAGRGCNRVVMLTFGTGIGGAAILDGKIYRGANGEHPELGHVPVLPDGPDCYCGRPGCLEALASGTAIQAAGNEAGFPDTRAVFAATAKGDQRAVAIIDRALESTASAAWTILHTFMPQVMILGGGIIDEHYDLFADVIQAQISRATLVPRESVAVARAALGNDAGIIGAAGLMLLELDAERPAGSD